LNQKLQFENQFKELIVNDNFPDICPIDSIQKNEIIGYGIKDHPIYKIEKFHNGIDIPATKGQNVKSTISGKVEIPTNRQKYFGKYIIIKTDEIEILFAHLDTILVDNGDEIEKGSIIGKVGNSGLSTRDHLHYEIKINDKLIDPIYTIFEYFDKENLENIYNYNMTTLD